MLDWLAVVDGYVIDSRMSDQEVYIRCQMFGSPAAAKAIENWINNFEIKVDNDSDV